ncbi:MULTISPECIES: hypothetical protein [Pseudomonas]|jgi:hypothetical protein|uniref:Uncharacterized protein n=1 Tax=Pseudomonas fluorescens TaxID=294 RepID=A0A109KVZ5_PSEFL|nr:MULTISPECIES: hypothetical protein [Pseudomonas]KAA6195577.1 hypothetical protein F3K52_09265 [Pseudomonas lactis]KRD02447.1 hypothetical protein ASE33_17725 [Pseudomonas sp. Root9]KWV76412.1 hypothetical protein PFL603g_02753 [Pseudomonas fluorescens]
MTFQLLVLSDPRTLAAALRAKLCRASAGFSPTRSTFATPSPHVRPASPLAHWRICPESGHLVQHWDHADPQDPQRPKVSSLSQARLLFGLYLSARAA